MTIDQQGRVTIPKRLREKYGLSPGTRVDFVELPEGIVLVPAQTSGEDAFAHFRGLGRNRPRIGDINEYLKESRGR